MLRGRFAMMIDDQFVLTQPSKSRQNVGLAPIPFLWRVPSWECYLGRLPLLSSRRAARRATVWEAMSGQVQM